MPPIDSLAGVLADLLDELVLDPNARDAAKLELLRAAATGGLGGLARMEARMEEGRSADPWTIRARPAFLYVMYALMLWSIPLGLLAAVRPAVAEAIAHGMTAYLGGIPEPMWALFGTGYLGYTAARTWGKIKGAA